MRVLFLADVFSGCTWYRCVVPAHALVEAGHEARVRVRDCNGSDIEWCDVLVVQRLFQTEALRAVEKANSLGKTTVYDLDDDLWSIGPDNSASEFWNLEKNQRAAVEVMRACSFATTTNDYLADVMRQFHPDVRVFPNALPDDFRKHGGEHDGLLIGWAGSKSHVADIRAVADVLRGVLDARPYVTLELCGAQPDWMRHHPQAYVRPAEFNTIETYHHVLSRYDIGIAPITDTRFNRCKSDLKFIEYAAVGVPAICSSVRPYTETVRHRETGYLARNDKDWHRFLIHLIDNEDARARLSANALEYAETRRIGNVIGEWVAIHGGRRL